MRRTRGLFVVLEGPDKSGKSTQAALLVRALRRRGRAVVHTREPGGTSFAEAVRRVVLSTAHKVEPVAELLLYEAARAQHTQEKILPALRRGAVVVSERYAMATSVYQGFARGLPRPMIESLNKVATGGLKPRLTIVLDIPVAEFGTRDRSRRHDRLELESSDFRARVRRGYRVLARRTLGAVLLDGRRPLRDLHEDILARVERALAP